MKIVFTRLELGSKIRNDYRQTVYIRLTKNKRMRRLNTGLFALSKDFDKDAQYGFWFKKSDQQYKGKNQILKDLIYKLESAHFYLDANKIAPTLNAIMKYMLNDDGKEADFFRYSERVLQQIKETGSASTFFKIKSSLKKFKNYVGGDLDFREITVEFLNDYESYLQNELHNQVNTRHSSLKTIRLIFGKAIQENQIGQEHYPFFQKKLRTEKTNRIKLSESQILRILDLDLSIGTSIGRSQRYFLFSYFACGMRFSDVCTMRRMHINDDFVLKYRMGKTGEEASFKLTTQAIKILEEFGFKDKRPDYFVFPLIDRDYSDPFELRRRISSSNALVNKDLKKIAKLAGIDERFGFHSARHTFATICLNKGIGVYEVSKMLRHSSVRVTEGYLKSFDSDMINRAMDSVFS